MNITERQIIVGTTADSTKSVASVHPVIILLSSCYTAALVMKSIFGHKLPGSASDTVIIDYHALFGGDIQFLDNSIDIDVAYLAGAGAIGNAFLYALRYFRVSGRINIVDPKRVRDGNLNRCMFFQQTDIGYYKAERLASIAQSHFTELKLVPHNIILSDIPVRSDFHWLKRLIVGVDSRRARRTLQSEIPCEVFDASTTDVREIVLHFHKQPTKGACLSCIYHQESGEISHELRIGEALGVSVEEVRSGFVTIQAAEKICLKYDQFQLSDFVGKAYDTLFKQLCGEGLLKTAEGRQVLAPFAFVSVLAGTYLAIEFVRRNQSNNQDEFFNYWRVSPWSSPVVKLKAFRPPRSNCEFCGEKIKRRVIEMLWSSNMADQK